jgi:hypothetical protein
VKKQKIILFFGKPGSMTGGHAGAGKNVLDFLKILKVISSHFDSLNCNCLKLLKGFCNC